MRISPVAEICSLHFVGDDFWLTFVLLIAGFSVPLHHLIVQIWRFGERRAHTQSGGWGAWQAFRHVAVARRWPCSAYWRRQIAENTALVAGYHRRSTTRSGCLWGFTFDLCIFSRSVIRIICQGIILILSWVIIAQNFSEDWIFLTFRSSSRVNYVLQCSFCHWSDF